jgi:membrane protein DedA with SNARE-associated domain
MLLTAGALQYPTRKFLAALAIGRGARYAIIAFLGAHYGRAIIRFFSQYYKPALIILIALGVLGGAFALIEYLRARKHRQEGTDTPRSTPKTRAA